MTLKPRLSVAIATYNGEKYIEKQLHSILQQTTPIDELVMSDDDSTDNTLSIARQVLKKTTIDWKIISNKYDRGYTTNFSTALEETTGDIVFLSDQDDVWLPNKVQAILSAFSESSAEMITHDAHVYWSRNRVRGPLISEILADRGIQPKENIFGCMMVVRRSLLDVSLPLQTNAVGHDTLLSAIAFHRGSRYYLAEALILYRRHDSNTTKSLFYKANNGKLILKNIKSFYDYSWLKKKKKELTVLYEIATRAPAIDVIPLAALRNLEDDLDRLNVRYTSLFDGGFAAVLRRFSTYQRAKIPARKWLKDLVAGAFGLHRVFTD